MKHLPFIGTLFIFVCCCFCTEAETGMLRLPPRNTALQLVAKDCQNIDPAVSLSFFINQVLEDTLSLVMPCVQDTAFGQHYSRTHEDSDKISYSGFNLSNVVLQYKVFMIHGSSGSVIREGEIPVGNDEFVIE